jgi:hypothetical protein
MNTIRCIIEALKGSFQNSKLYSLYYSIALSAMSTGDALIDVDIIF